MTISIIAAVSENWVIGADGDMPWRLPDDLKHFKKLTVGKPIIMGRKTFESLGSKPLPDRPNIVLTRAENYSVKGITIANSWRDALDIAKHTASAENEVCIVGGEKVFALGLPITNVLYLTRVHKTAKGDTYFPQVDFGQWKLVSSETHKKDARNSDDYTFEKYVRK